MSGAWRSGSLIVRGFYQTLTGRLGRPFSARAPPPVDRTLHGGVDLAPRQDHQAPQKGPEQQHYHRADGAGEIGILWHVIAPLSRPAIAVLIINTAIINWNSFLFPLILTDTASVRTLPVALAMFSQGPHATDWGALMAGASVSSLPIIAIFWMFQKEIIEGITSGALKD